MIKIIFILILFASTICCYIIPENITESNTILPTDIEVSKILYTYKEDSVFSSEQNESIYKFLNTLNKAIPDTSDDNFKSFYFCYFFYNDSLKFRIEILNSRYRFNQNRYKLEKNIEKLIKNIFQVDF